MIGHDRETKSQSPVKSLTLFTLQGLGNSIVALPLLTFLNNRYTVTLYVADKESASFYSDLKIGKVVLLDTLFKILLNRAEKSEIAVSLFPNWKRELWQLKRARAHRKISFFDEGYPYTKRGKTEKINAEKIHDIENNFKLLKVLGIPEKYPDLSQRFDERRKRKISLHLTASKDYKYYPKKFWLNLIDYFIKENFEIDLFIGNSNEEKIFLKGLLHKLKPTPLVRIHIGERLTQVARILAQSEAFIGLDSALMHLAAMLDVFTIGLWSYADYRRIYPYGNQAFVYIPKETLETNSFHPKKNVAIKRADYADVLKILTKTTSPDFSIKPKFVNAVRFYSY